MFPDRAVKFWERIGLLGDCSPRGRMIENEKESEGMGDQKGRCL